MNLAPSVIPGLEMSSLNAPRVIGLALSGIALGFSGMKHNPYLLPGSSTP